jgi:hypothetical protein
MSAERTRLEEARERKPFADFEAVMQARRREADEFYASVIPASIGADGANVMRQALAGMLWTKQFYNYDLDTWLAEHGADPYKPRKRAPRNDHWHHMANADVISMPDKWEYPWYAAWDLAFHVLPLTLVDEDFGKQQLDLMLQERYIHPNGQIPAYEWNFGDVNPPVHAWATIFTYRLEKALRGEGDLEWLERSYQKLALNFTWWLNRKDRSGNTGMWDEEDGFFYDVLRLPDGSSGRLKVRSMVGLLPLCAVTVFAVGGQEYRVDYLPGESDSGMFGGNSNWRGPVWMPVNALIIRALLQYYAYYGDDFRIECPTGSGRQMSLYQVAEELTDAGLRPEPLWSADTFVAFAWEGLEGERLLVAVKSPHQSQCFVRLAQGDLPGPTWRLDDQLGSETWDRDGNDLATRGLYLDVPAWQASVFCLRQATE